MELPSSIEGHCELQASVQGEVHAWLTYPVNHIWDTWLFDSQINKPPY